MKLFERLTPDFHFADERGELTQLVHEGYEQVNVLFTKAGVVRGGHYHKIAQEAFYVLSGCVTVDFQKDDQACSVTFGKDEFFKIHTHVNHTMHFEQDTILVAMYDRRIEDNEGNKDIFITPGGSIYEHV